MPNKLEDRPDQDLLQMLDDATLLKITDKQIIDLAGQQSGKTLVAIDKDLLMQKLCSYVVRRDSKVWNHAYKLGQDKEIKAHMSHPEIKQAIGLLTDCATFLAASNTLREDPSELVARIKDFVENV